MATRKRPSPFPSVDRMSRLAEVERLVEPYGRSAVIEAIRAVLVSHRVRKYQEGTTSPSEATIASDVANRLARRAKLALRPVFNLTGTVLHTNLGRALLPEAAVEQVASAMREPCALEYDLDSGERGERDRLIEELLCELTGAAAATIVNNNAAAVLLVLAALVGEGEVVLSRGEMIEIGGSFRIPDVMRSAGAQLVEVGTTNRTHPADYAAAITPATRALMKVHASNYEIKGFVAEVAEAEIAAIAHAHDLPMIVDLGSGSLIDLSAHGLPREPVVRDTIGAGADIVTFSGDKLLGGPQAGLIVGRRELVEKIRRHPLKRALRVSKLVLAALEGTLMAYRNPDALRHTLPTLRLLTRPLADLEALAERLMPPLAAVLGLNWRVGVMPVHSQIGSGSLPSEIIPSVALVIGPAMLQSGPALEMLAQRLRRLPVPVIGRIAAGHVILDLRCLEDERRFTEQLPAFNNG